MRKIFPGSHQRSDDCDQPLGLKRESPQPGLTGGPREARSGTPRTMCLLCRRSAMVSNLSAGPHLGERPEMAHPSRSRSLRRKSARLNGHRPFSLGGGNGSKCPIADPHPLFDRQALKQIKPRSGARFSPLTDGGSLALRRKTCRCCRCRRAPASREFRAWPGR